MDEEPRYGRRLPREDSAENGFAVPPQGAGAPTPNAAQMPPQPVPPQAQSQAQAQPQYGQPYSAQQPAQQQAPQPMQPPYGQSYAAQQQAPQFPQGQQPLGQQQPHPQANQSYPYGAPQQQSPQWQSAYPPNAPVPVELPKLPGRTGPTLLIVFGILAAIIVAPLAFLVGAIGDMGVFEIAESMNVVSSGSTVVVDDSRGYMLNTDSSEVHSCTLTHGDKTIVFDSAGAGSFMAFNVEAGEYELHCEGADGATMFGTTGISSDTMTNAVLTGFWWATFIGFAGVAMVIGGIIWMVKNNARRRELMRSVGYRA